MSFFIVALAVWRISSLFVQEDGPGDIFARFRNWVGVRFDDYSSPYGTSFFSRLVLCVWCFSVWAGFFAAIWYLLSEKIAVALALPFAFSAFAIVVDSVVVRRH